MYYNTKIYYALQYFLNLACGTNNIFKMITFTFLKLLKTILYIPQISYYIKNNCPKLIFMADVVFPVVLFQIVQKNKLFYQTIYYFFDFLHFKNIFCKNVSCWNFGLSDRNHKLKNIVWNFGFLLYVKYPKMVLMVFFPMTIPPFALNKIMNVKFCVRI